MVGRNYFHVIKNDETKLSDALNYYSEQYENAVSEVSIKGNLQDNISQLSSQYEFRFSQLQEIEAILSHFEHKMMSIRATIHKDMIENSRRQLTSSDIKQYVDGSEKVIAFQIIINEITLVRNKFLALTKGFETKQYMLNNITKLQCAGLDCVTIK